MLFWRVPRADLTESNSERSWTICCSSEGVGGGGVVMGLRAGGGLDVGGGGGVDAGEATGVWYV